MTKSSASTENPWVLDLRAIGLVQGAGTARVHELAITANAPDDTVSGVLHVEPDQQVTLDGRAETVSEGVMVSASISADAHGNCSRCLDEITVPLEATIRELYAYPDSTTAETTDEDEVPRIDDDRIDLAPAVHDELVLAMPTIPLCREDCPGLCPECGEHLDSVGPDHSHEIIDPRWAALAGLLDPKTKEK